MRANTYFQQGCSPGQHISDPASFKRCPSFPQEGQAALPPAAIAQPSMEGRLWARGAAFDLLVSEICCHNTCRWWLILRQKFATLSRWQHGVAGDQLVSKCVSPCDTYLPACILNQYACMASHLAN